MSPVTKRFWQDVNEPALASLKANILTRKDREAFQIETPLRSTSDGFFTVHRHRLCPHWLLHLFQRHDGSHANSGLPF